MAKVKEFFFNNLHWLILAGVALLCAIFLFAGKPDDKGYISLTNGNVTIDDSTKEFIESSKQALYRIMNENAPTDEQIVKEYADGWEGDEGLGASTTLDAVISRQKPDGDNDNGKGWQCSKYTAYLATGKKDYSSAHPDYGPVNGKNVVAWLVKNFGWKYIDTPVRGAIGSGGFNTLYGHTAEFLYWVSDGVAMVSDANYVPLTVATHPIDVSDWVWAVPGDYTPDPQPEPSPAPTPSPQPVTPTSGDTVEYTYTYGDYFSKVLINLGLDEKHLWGEEGSVQYYTNQLIEQNMLDYRGNVKVGVPFKLIVR